MKEALPPDLQKQQQNLAFTAGGVARSCAEGLCDETSVQENEKGFR